MEMMIQTIKLKQGTKFRAKVLKLNQNKPNLLLFLLPF